MRWIRHVACLGEVTKEFKVVFVLKPEGKPNHIAMGATIESDLKQKG
jgi:hypothetical protein